MRRSFGAGYFIPQGYDPDSESGILSGNKLLVYIIIKILNKCTDAKLQFFRVTFVVFNVLAHSRYEAEDIGSSLERVLRCWTVREKVKGVEELGKYLSGEIGPFVQNLTIC